MVGPFFGVILTMEKRWTDMTRGWIFPQFANFELVMDHIIWKARPPTRIRSVLQSWRAIKGGGGDWKKEVVKMDLPIIVIDVIFWSGALCKNVGLEVLALQLCCICQFWRVPRTWLNLSERSTKRKKTLHKMQLLAWWFSVYGFWHPLARRIEGATRDLDLTKRLWASPMNTTTSHAREHCNWIFGSTLLYTLQKRDREEKIIVDFCYILQEKLKWPQKLYFLLTPQMTRERVGSREKCSDGQLWRSTLRARLFRSGCKISSNEKRRHQMRPSLRSALLFSGNRLKKTLLEGKKHSQQSRIGFWNLVC